MKFWITLGQYDALSSVLDREILLALLIGTDKPVLLNLAYLTYHVEETIEALDWWDADRNWSVVVECDSRVVHTSVPVLMSFAQFHAPGCEDVTCVYRDLPGLITALTKGE